jgi:hypothetical protein
MATVVSAGGPVTNCCASITLCISSVVGAVVAVVAGCCAAILDVVAICCPCARQRTIVLGGGGL